MNDDKVNSSHGITNMRLEQVRSATLYTECTGNGCDDGCDDLKDLLYCGILNFHDSKWLKFDMGLIVVDWTVGIGISVWGCAATATVVAATVTT